MVIFHSYVSLPEGIDVDAPFGLFSRVSWFDQKKQKNFSIFVGAAQTHPASATHCSAKGWSS